MADIHPFDTAVDLTQSGEGSWAGTPSPAYANMVGSFGGMTTATVLNAVMRDPRRHGDPVTMTVNFCSGMSKDDFVITSKLCRTGKYTQHWTLEMSQGEALCATATVVCGVRTDVYSHQPVDINDIPAAADCPVTETFGFLRWLERYKFRFIEGAPVIENEPYAEPKSPHSKVWVSDNPPRPLDHLSLSALADSFLLRLLQVRGTMAPMGSVSITTHFLATQDEIAAQGSEPVLAIADSTRFHGHFHDQNIQMFATDGKLLASGTQLVWYRQ